MNILAVNICVYKVFFKISLSETAGERKHANEKEYTAEMAGERKHANEKEYTAPCFGGSGGDDGGGREKAIFFKINIRRAKENTQTKKSTRRRAGTGGRKKTRRKQVAGGREMSSNIVF